MTKSRYKLLGGTGRVGYNYMTVAISAICYSKLVFQKYDQHCQNIYSYNINTHILLMVPYYCACLTQGPAKQIRSVHPPYKANGHFKESVCFIFISCHCWITIVSERILDVNEIILGAPLHFANPNWNGFLNICNAFPEVVIDVKAVIKRFGCPLIHSKLWEALDFRFNELHNGYPGRLTSSLWCIVCRELI